MADFNQIIPNMEEDEEFPHQSGPLGKFGSSSKYIPFIVDNEY